MKKVLPDLFVLATTPRTQVDSLMCVPASCQAIQVDAGASPDGTVGATDGCGVRTAAIVVGRGVLDVRRVGVDSAAAEACAGVAVMTRSMTMICGEHATSKTNESRRMSGLVMR